MTILLMLLVGWWFTPGYTCLDSSCDAVNKMLCSIPWVVGLGGAPTVLPVLEETTVALLRLEFFL